MAEAENLYKVFTIDRRDFAAYRIKRGHRLRAFELIEPEGAEVDQFTRIGPVLPNQARR